MKPNSPLIKPNVLALALLATVLVVVMAQVATGEQALVAVVGLASVVLGFFGSVMFILSAPPPNPDVDARFASKVLDLAAGATDNPVPEAVEQGPRTMILLALIGVAAAISVLAIFSPDVPLVAAVGLANATVGMIGGTVGKLVEPEPETTVPQSVVLEALRFLAENSGKTARS